MNKTNKRTFFKVVQHLRKQIADTRTPTMAENAPPTSAGASGQGDSSRGMPYFEKLRRDLRNTIKQKRELEERMVR